MTIIKLSNHHSFYNECKDKGVTIDLLLEAQICLGKQATSKLFKGRAKRQGGYTISSIQVENWIHTLKFAQENPQIPDENKVYMPRIVDPTDEWYQFTEIVKTPIDEDIIKSWDYLSNPKLGKEIQNYGLTFGTANNKALRNLRQRVNEMVERRRTKFWSVKEEITDNSKPEINFNSYSFLHLQQIGRRMGADVNNISKEELVRRLEARQTEMETEKHKIFEQPYIHCNTRQLKTIAKEKCIPDYNVKKKDELIKLLETCDLEEKIQIEEKDKITLCGVEIISREPDGYINATQICKAGNKLYGHWYENKKTIEFLQTLSKNIGIPILNLIDCNKGRNQETWVHPKVAINIAQWVSVEFSIKVTDWVYELLNKGHVEIDGPCKAFTTLSEIDIEASKLEKDVNIAKYSNTQVIYVAYIGRGLVKIGYSDRCIINRNMRHTSCETEYSEWRIIALFEVSSSVIEKDLHKFLFVDKAVYNKQKEVFLPKTKLSEYINKISDYLEENDHVIVIRRLREENLKLKLELSKYS